MQGMDTQMCVPDTHDNIYASASNAPSGSHGKSSQDRGASHKKENWRISPGNIVDLSHMLSPHIPLFPKDPALRLDTAHTFEDEGYYDCTLFMIEHAGTHVDAPLHFDENGGAIHDIPVEQLISPLVIVDVKDRVSRDENTTVHPDDLLSWENRHGTIPDGAVVIMNSGWHSRYSDPKQYCNADSQGVYHFPGWGEEAAHFLMDERNAVGIGVDTFSLDSGANSTTTGATFPAHNAWLGGGGWGLESVANLDAVPASGAMLIVGMPNLCQGTGMPARLMAAF